MTVIYRPSAHRRRVLTEMFGVLLSKAEAEALRAHVTAQKTNISAYLREQAIRPLLAQAEVGPDGSQE